VGAGFSTVTPPPSQVSSTSIAQTVWSYSTRSLTVIQNLVSAVQNNNPSLLYTQAQLADLPLVLYSGLVSETQAAAFINSAVLSYGMATAVAGLMANVWDHNFTGKALSSPYLTSTAVATVLAQLNAVSAQSLLYWLAQNYYYNAWINAVTSFGPASITFSTNATLSTNVLIAQNITIASGVTVTCGTQTCFFVAQSFNNYGTIVSPHGAPGAPPLTQAGAGGTGGGGIVVVAITSVLGTLNVSGSPGSNATGYSGATGTGYAGSAGTFYVVTGVAVPVGGTGSGGSYAGPAGYNGGGGGGSYNSNSAAPMYDGGPGSNATIYSFSSPDTMLTYILQGVGDWFLINVAGKAPPSVTPLAFMYGSGGGGGGESSGYQSGGGGGGGAGEVVAYGYNIVSGTINAVGGAGGAGVSPSTSVCASCYGEGGGGGGGGLAFIFYGATSGSITANMAGGAGGTSTNGAAGGAAGASGTAYIAAVIVNG
jgi:hypothetical protein